MDLFRKARYYKAMLSQPLLRNLIVIAILAWLILLGLENANLILANNGGDTISHHHHHVKIDGSAWEMLTQHLNLHWFLMLVTMMLPLLSLPVENVSRKLFSRKRYVGIAGFFLGYIVFWTFVGTFLSSIMTFFSDAFEYVSIYQIEITAFIVVLWQATPWKQYCLNRHHFLPVINPFGWHAFYDSFKYGLKNAFWCVGSCWAIMWFSLAVMKFGMWSMPFFSILMFIDQNRRWQPATWNMPFKNFMPMNRNKKLKKIGF